MSYCPFFEVRKDRIINIDSERSDSPYGSSPNRPANLFNKQSLTAYLIFCFLCSNKHGVFVFNYLYPCSPSRFTSSPNIAPQGLSNILQHNCASFCNVRKTSNRHLSTLRKKLKKSFYCIMWDGRVWLRWVMRWEGFPKFRFSVPS